MFTVIDKFTGELLEFDDKMDAEMIAQRRLSMHKNGYNLRRNHIAGCEKANLKIEGRKYIIDYE